MTLVTFTDRREDPDARGGRREVLLCRCGGILIPYDIYHGFCLNCWTIQDSYYTQDEYEEMLDADEEFDEPEEDWEDDELFDGIEDFDPDDVEYVTFS